MSSDIYNNFIFYDGVANYYTHPRNVYNFRCFLYWFFAGLNWKRPKYAPIFADILQGVDFYICVRGFESHPLRIPFRCRELLQRIGSSFEVVSCSLVVLCYGHLQSLDPLGLLRDGGLCFTQLILYPSNPISCV